MPTTLRKPQNPTDELMHRLVQGVLAARGKRRPGENTRGPSRGKGSFGEEGGGGAHGPSKPPPPPIVPGTLPPPYPGQRKPMGTMLTIHLHA